MSRQQGHFLLTACMAVVGVVAVSRPVEAGFISSPGGGYRVGISDFGNLYDSVSGVGFRRLIDMYDPIAPGMPREGYGLAAGGSFATADHVSGSGNNNISSNLSVFGSNSATVTIITNFNIRLTQAYTFAAENVLKIENTITNLSGVSQILSYRRAVDFDIGGMTEQIIVDPLATPVVSAGYGPFESSNPLAGYNFSTSGGMYGPGDFGGAYTLNFGSLANSGSVSFVVFYGINDGPSQNVTGLRSQVSALGGDFLISAQSGTDSAVLAYGPVALAPTSATPIPPTAFAVVVGLVGLTGLHRLRRPTAA